MTKKSPIFDRPWEKNILSCDIFVVGDYLYLYIHFSMSLIEILQLNFNDPPAIAPPIMQHLGETRGPHHHHLPPRPPPQFVTGPNVSWQVCELCLQAPRARTKPQKAPPGGFKAP